MREKKKKIGMREKEREIKGGTCYSIKRFEDYRAGNKARLTGSLFFPSLSDSTAQHPLPIHYSIMPTCAYFIPFA
jgi:hypothetical protein